MVSNSTLYFTAFISLTVPEIGGYSKFVTQGFNHNYFPVWMQQAGYNTYYAGKFMNGHGADSYNDPFPAGFNQTNCKSELELRVYQLE